MLTPPYLINWQNQFAKAILNPTEDTPEGLFLYHEAYWEKMWNKLGLHYHILVKLLGEAFWKEEIADPFIAECSYRHNELEDWLAELPHWLLKNQKEKLSPLLVPFSELESLQLKVYLDSCLSLPSQDSLHSTRFLVQPHLNFFSSRYPLLSYRKLLLDGLTIPLPKEGDETWMALSLNRIGNVVINPLDSDEKRVLEIFNGRTLEEALTHVLEMCPELIESASAKIGEWTRRWMSLGWLGVSPP